jgi:hypothetical protein
VGFIYAPEQATVKEPKIIILDFIFIFPNINQMKQHISSIKILNKILSKGFFYQLFPKKRKKFENSSLFSIGIYTQLKS